MPAKSKKQFKFMQAIASGNLKKPGLTKEDAKQFLKDNKKNLAYKKLPEKK